MAPDGSSSTCPSCSRHLRDDETRCPFCAAELASVVPQPVPDARLCRAAIMAMSTALAAGAIGGCDGSGKKPPEPITAAPAYGAPPLPLSSSPTAGASASASASVPAPTSPQRGPGGEK